MRERGGGQSAYVYGSNFYRLRSKLLRCGHDLQRVDRNLDRHSRYNDQEAWEGLAIGPEGQNVPLFSWQTVTDLLKRGPLAIAPESGRGGGRPILTTWTRYEVTREDV